LCAEAKLSDTSQEIAKLPVYTASHMLGVLPFIEQE
jgi:hypothetical protein